MKDNLQIPSELLEEYIIISAINNKAFFLKIYKYLKTPSFKKSYFNDEKNQIIFNIVAIWYEKYNMFPSLRDFDLLLEKVPIDAEIKTLVKGMATKYYSEDISQINQKNIAEQTQKFVQESRVYEAMMMAQKDIQEENYGAIVERMKEAVTVNFDKDLGISFTDTTNVMKAVTELTDDDSAIDSGIPILNNLIGGGFKKGEQIVIAAPPGVGKTLVLGCFGLNAFISGKKVLILTMETSTPVLLMRYLQNFTQREKSSIVSDMETAKRIMDNKFEMMNNGGDLIVKEYPSNQPCANDFIALMTDLEMYKGWKPDMLIVDYLLITATNDNRLDPGDSYKYYKRVAEDVRNIAKEYKIPVLTACQINREGQAENGGTKALITSKNVSESRGILDTADIFITLNQTSSQKSKSEIMFYIDKNRNGSAQQKFTCEVNYELMTLRQKDVSRAK